MPDRSYRHLKEMYDRDMVRWRQRGGPMPMLTDYLGKPKSEGCFLWLAKFLGLVILGAIGSALIGLFGVYVLMRMITG